MLHNASEITELPQEISRDLLRVEPIVQRGELVGNSLELGGDGRLDKAKIMSATTSSELEKEKDGRSEARAIGRARRGNCTAQRWAGPTAGCGFGLLEGTWEPVAEEAIEQQEEEVA